VSIRCVWSSPTTAAAWARAEPPPSTSTATESARVGYDSGTPVSDDYTSQNGHFNGKIKWVQLDAGADDHDHLISDHERLRVAMALQ
jgi:hypothetical protein